MSKIVEDFLGKVKEQKIEQLLGIALDKKYWVSVLGDRDVEMLRDDLGKEQEKMVKNRNGTIHQDNRDMDKINKLNIDINKLQKATEELLRLTLMEEDIGLYMAFVEKPSEETIKELEEIAKK